MEGFSFALPSTSRGTQNQEARAIFEGTSSDSRPAGRDASGVFKLTEEKAAPKVIELPEAYKRLRAKQVNETPTDEVKETDSKKPEKSATTASLTPGLQFVGKAAREGKPLKSSSDAPQEGELPMLMMNQVVGLDEAGNEDERFKKDVSARPEVSTLDAYEAMPVEEFGKALLRGMGWKEGAGVGRTNQKAVEPIQYVPRPERLGLGAQPKKEPQPGEEQGEGKRRRIARPGEEGGNVPGKKDRVYETGVGPDGKIRHYVSVGEGLVEKAKLEMKEGALVGIVGGAHEGLLAKVKRLEGEGSVMVELPSGANVSVTKAYTVLLDPRMLQREGGMDQVKQIMTNARKELKQNEEAMVKKRVKPERDDDSSDDKKKKKKKKKDKKDKKQRKKSSCWLVPGIVVRCISKTFQGGALYQKKLVVMDMKTSDVASTVMYDDRQRIVDDISEDLVETAMPQVGGLVRVVRGSDRYGELGVLRERNSEKNKATVQMEDDGMMETFKMDDVAQWVGVE